ncbi:chemotaxis protein CheX [Gemmata sp. JC717]|uniref:Chemotaxis protein CheX n=1 Tax=Gemmata algarum TaxID=2975278 RepID=A0ABU5F6U6_9BACT|nr:chemotaxis protein CheX [Gemmata algarum]MDY3555914.1 chemotaxis protein CheX [Gemmata algarum]MDY3563316.1 chemotaxis protein CheX [Gemmata algarum]
MPDVLPPTTTDAIPKAITQAVQEATTAFFTTSCGLTHVPDAAGDEEAAGAGIMSAISFLGDRPWAFAMALPETSAVALAKAFAGFEIPFDSQDMGDLLGEVVNVIAGDISARLNAEGIQAQMSLPMSVRGADVTTLVPHGVATNRLLFEGPHGRCWLDLVSDRFDGLTFRQPGMG